jgi:hypothetical protein
MTSFLGPKSGKPPPNPRAIRRAGVIKRMSIAIAALVSLLAVAGWFAARQRLRSQGAVLIADARVVAAKRWERPSHRPPAEPGDANACLATALSAGPKLPPLLKLGAGLRKLREGGGAYSTLPQADRDTIDGVVPWLHQVVECTRFTALEPRQGVSPLMHPIGGTLPLAVSAADEFGALHLADLVERGQGGEALEWCADLLAFMRDAAWDCGIPCVRRLPEQATTLALACGPATVIASADQKLRFARELEVIRSSLPPLGDVFEHGRVTREVEIIGALLPSDLFAALPSGARDWAIASAPSSSLLERTGYGLMDAEFREIVAAAAEAEPARTAHLAAIVSRRHGLGAESHAFEALATAREVSDLDTTIQLMQWAAQVDLSSSTLPAAPGGLAISRTGTDVVLTAKLTRKTLQLRLTPPKR